jgi:hypothetical protein
MLRGRVGDLTDYQRLIDQIRDFVRAALPPAASVIVVSRGDDALLQLDGRRASHFPRALDGEYAGAYPANGDDALAQLARARHEGGEFLLFPRSALWWLDHYPELKSYLEQHCPPPRVAEHDAARIFDLRHIGVDAATASWNDTAKSLRAYAFEPQRAPELDRLLAQLLRLRLSLEGEGNIFETFQQLGLHVLPVHYYSPVPDTRELPNSLWARDTSVGIDWNEPMQLDLLQNAFPPFRTECDALPRELLADNDMFAGLDTLAYYCMIRHFKPKRVLEVGSGSSSRVAARAALANGTTELTCIEPYPSPELRAGFPGLSKLVIQVVQDVPLRTFEHLEANDILFIDSTHVVKVGSDVNYLFFEILPHLRPGVIVHVHDIFLPREYPVEWVKQKHIFWNEQYLLRAFLMFNQTFEVLLSNALLTMKYPKVTKKAFPAGAVQTGASFWMRRKI